MSKRADRARDTRRRIVEAAARLFVRDGYAATSIQAIADEAGVAVPTVYATLRTKANILRAAFELTVRGDDGSLPLSARAAWQEIEAESDPRKQIDKFARFHTEVCGREAAVFAQIAAAAGSAPEATQGRADHDRLRHQTQSRLARKLRSRDRLQPGLTTPKAADMIWTLASERTYLALVRDRGWKPADYRRWLSKQLQATLLPGA